MGDIVDVIRSGRAYQVRKKTPSLERLANYSSKLPERLAYTPILDNRFDLAANYLTIEDMKSSYELLKESFTEISISAFLTAIRSINVLVKSCSSLNL